MYEMEFVNNILVSLATRGRGGRQYTYLEYVVYSATVSSHDDLVLWRKQVNSAASVSYVSRVKSDRPFGIDLLVRWIGSEKHYRVVAVPNVVGGGDPSQLVEEIPPTHNMYEHVERLHLQIEHWFRRREIAGKRGVA